MKSSSHPQTGEFDPYYSKYLALVPEDDVIGAIEAQGRITDALLQGLSETQAAHRYAEGKWSVKQLVGHVADATRVFAYRLLSIGRGEQRSLPGFDEKSWAETGRFDDRTLAELIDGLESARTSAVHVLRALPEDAWSRLGAANDSPISVRALARIIVGHERHHMNVLRERYLKA